MYKKLVMLILSMCFCVPGTDAASGTKTNHLMEVPFTCQYSKIPKKVLVIGVEQRRARIVVPSGMVSSMSEHSGAQIIFDPGKVSYGLSGLPVFKGIQTRLVPAKDKYDQWHTYKFYHPRNITNLKNPVNIMCTQKGLVFGKQPSKGDLPPVNGNGFCKDHCGDGVCQEMVCMAEGCPCAETAESCPQDCA